MDAPRLTLLLLSLALTLPITSAYALDLAGLPLRPASLAVAAAAQVAIATTLLGRRAPGRIAPRPTRLLGLALSFGLTLAIGLRFAWPTMLPVSTSVDEVNHYLLADYIVRHGQLPRGDEAASLVEMAQYPFGPHLLVALGARLLGLPAFYLLHPLAALALAATAAFAYGIVADQVEGRPGGDLAALAAPVVLLWPAAYTLGQFTSDFFLAQMFGLTCLVGALYWGRGRSPLALSCLVALGAGLVFSYPTLLPIFGLGVALARRRWLDLAVVGLPIGALAGLYLVGRAGTGLEVVRQGGVALAPGLETLPPLFLAAGAAGLAWASRRRERSALAGFALAALLQTAVFALAYRLTGELSRYAVEKMVYVLVPLLAVLAAALLARGLTASSLGGLAVRQVALLVLVVASVQVGPRLARPVGDRVPTAALTTDLIAAASWLRERAPGEAPLYLTPDHLPAYWVEIGLLKRDRTAAALPRFHDRVRPPGHYWAWRARPGSPGLALVTRDADALVGPEVEERFRAGGAAVVARGRDLASKPPPYRWVGGELVLLEASTATRRGRPGGELRLEVALGTVAPPRTDYALVARLRDWRGQVRAEAQQVVASAGLAGGRRTSAALALPLDPSLPRGAYRVELLTFKLPAWDLVPARVGPEPDAPESPVVTAPLLVAPPDALPPLDFVPRWPIGARFGDQVELVGVGVESSEPRDRQLEVDLVWRALRPLDRDYSVFVHLVDGAGQVVAQADGFAWDGAYPTSAWEAGQPLIDRRRLPLPGAGPYQLRVGLYRLDSGQRLPVGDGDFVVAAALP